MPRKCKLNPEEIFENTPVRIKLNKWDLYQVPLEDEKKRWAVFISIHRMTDSLNKSLPPERLIWLELIRLSGAGRRLGWVVIGDNEPITVNDISRMLNLELDFVLEGIRQNIAQNRITVNLA